MPNIETDGTTPDRQGKQQKKLIDAEREDISCNYFLILMRDWVGRTI